MKKPYAVLVSLMLVLLALHVNGCGGNTRKSAIDDDDDSSTASAPQPVDAATAGSIVGLVKVAGTPRKPRAINMAAVPNCAKMHSSPATIEDVVPGDNGTLQNVVVYLKGNFRQYSFDPAKSVVMLDQKGCTYGPHVLALMTGQQLQISNSDQASHNVNAAPKLNSRWNESQPAGAAPVIESFARAEVGIPVKCNVHPWMKAYISVFSHPRLATSHLERTRSLPGTSCMAPKNRPSPSKRSSNRLFPSPLETGTAKSVKWVRREEWRLRTIFDSAHPESRHDADGSSSGGRKKKMIIDRGRGGAEARVQENCFLFCASLILR